MTYAKIRLPKSPEASRALVEMVRKYRLFGIRENGEVVYQIPMAALEMLDDSAVPYELLASELAEPVRPSAVR